MRLMRFAAGAAVLATVMFVASAPVSTQVTALNFDTGPVGLGLALRQLPVESAALYVTAHPDDENNGVLVALDRGRGIKTSLLTVTRGDGGQNEIGPELFQAIGILRSEELAAVHKYDGVDQYHTRAYEFGYSFSVEETFEKWGKDEILADVVKVIRMTRPDVILTMNRDGQAGGQHHMGSARLAHEAFRVAADPTRFPEQIKAGLRPWQARKIYQAGAGNPGGGAAQSSAGGAAPPQRPVRISTGDYDPLLGMSWAQFGTLARRAHLCQGMGQTESRPGDAGGSYSLYDSEPKVTGDEDDVYQDIDISLRRMTQFVAGQEAAVPSLAADLGAIEASARAAIDAFDTRATQKTLPHLAKGLAQVRALRSTVAASRLTADPKAELTWRLDRKESEFMRALELAQGMVVHVTVPDGNVVRGQTFDVMAQVFNTGPEPMKVDEVALQLPQGWTSTLKQGQPGELKYNEAATVIYTVTVGPAARYSQPYWKRKPGKVEKVGGDIYDLEIPAHHLLPWSPPDVTATVKYTAGGASGTLNAPAYYRYDGPWVGGEKQKVLNIVPNLSVKLTPSIAVVPLVAGGKKKEFRVSVLNNAQTGSDVKVHLEVPAGWTVEPTETTLKFSVEEEEMSAQFFVTPPAKVTAGEAEIRAVAVRGTETFREGYQVIAYNHIQTRHLFHPATSKIKMIDVVMPENLQVGYVMGTGDEVPDAIRQLGATVTMLSADDIAFGNLSKYSTIVLGIRAYEKRPDLRAYNQRLFDFARNGGHLVVQYNKTAMNQLGGGQAGPPAGGFGGGAPGGPGGAAGGGGRGGGRGAGAPPSSPYVPYPGGITSNRITVEEAPIRILEDGTTEMTRPNKITAADFEGWVQERGLYFFGANDPRYTDILAATDPWAFNPGEKKGMLTVAQLGKGTWTYVGLGLWRQVPAGTPGAYRILANLIK
jgi:LmbE family N-acetylglucosaminyl deacetylase